MSQEKKHNQVNETEHFSHEDLSNEHHVRVEKVKKLREMGIEPWPEHKAVSATTSDVLEGFKEGQEASYTIAGRITALRWHGKSAFAKLCDRTGFVQIYFKKDALGDAAFDLLSNFIDVGDLIWVKGISFKTKTDEITLRADEFTLLAKCLHPLPEKFHGLVDIETKYRQRYLDIISDSESRHRFITRSKIVSNVRRFLENHAFMEVETPMLHPIAGGAAAKPFTTFHNALSADFFLRIAPELYLKRLVVGGFERVYEINRNFRNEGISTRHNPEFTMLEFYLAHHDYHYIMSFVEKMLQEIAQNTNGTKEISFHGHTIDLSKPFVRLSVEDAVLQYGKLTKADITPQSIDAQLKKFNIHLKVKETSYAQKLFLLFEEVAEKQLIQPTFIIDYPVEISPLAKSDPQKPGYVARFELFIGGMEFANGFNELNDPFDQESRFKEQSANHEAGDDEAHRYDAEFVQALQYGLFPTVGCGIGIDRLVMLMTNAPSIKDVILFPTLRKKDL